MERAPSGLVAFLCGVSSESLKHAWQQKIVYQATGRKPYLTQTHPSVYHDRFSERRHLAGGFHGVREGRTAGKIPALPIRRGREKASVIL